MPRSLGNGVHTLQALMDPLSVSRSLLSPYLVLFTQHNDKNSRKKGTFCVYSHGVLAQVKPLQVAEFPIGPLSATNANLQYKL